MVDVASTSRLRVLTVGGVPRMNQKHTSGTAARIMVLVSSDRRRGAEVFGEALAAGLAASGWEVDFVSLATAPDGPRVSAEPISVVSPDELGKLDRDVVGALRSRVAAWSPDIVLANGSSTMQYAVAGLRVMRNRPRLVYVSIGDPLWWIRSRRHQLIRSGILKGVDRVFSVSATTARHLTSELGVSGERLRIAPTGVPPRFFDVTRDPRGDALRIVFVGNLSQEKDPLAALAIVTEVAATTPVEMRFLGGGPLRDDLETAVAATGLGDRIDVLGSVPDVLPHLAWADTLLLTSHTEGLPGVPLEAGAAGVPTVAYDVGGTAETVIDGETGRIVAPGDHPAAVAALIAMAENRERTAAWGDAARRMVSARFTLEGAVQRYIDLLEDELAERSRKG